MPLGARCSQLLFVVAQLLPVSLEAPPVAAQSSRALVVATRQAPPFAMQRQDGSWHGISIDLWRTIADDLGLTFRFEPMGLEEMIDAVADGSVDAGVAALTVTADREQRLDFSHPFHASGLAIAVPTDEAGMFAKLIRTLLSLAFLKAFAALVLVLGVIGLSIWLLERRRNPEHFGGTRAAGMGSGFWWAAVTMTTVGYGDKVPKTGGGRVLGTVWMFVSIITISGFTAAIASALTAFHLSSDIQGPRDLVDRQVGTVAGSAAQSALIRLGVRSEGYQTLEECLDQLDAGVIDALVYDAPLLLYRAATTHRDRLLVLPRVFEEYSYAIALPPGSPLREPVNQSLLTAISGSEWDAVLNQYLIGGE